MVRTEFDRIWIEEVGRSGEGLAIENEDDADDKENTKNRDFRTCTATLNQILRPDLSGEGERILDLIESAQRDLSITMDELSVLTLKATHVVSTLRLAMKQLW